MSECTSTRGQWGGICPACGKPLPANPGPLRSWKSLRDLEFPSGASAGLGDRNQVLVDAQKRRRSEAHRGPRGPYGSRGITERQAEVWRIVQKHGGNKSAAARELGVTVPTIITTLHRLAAAS